MIAYRQAKGTGVTGRMALVTLGCIALLSGLAIMGCSNRAEQICDTICECEGCSKTERSDCVDKGEAAIADADDKGCGDVYDDYLGCVLDEAECRNDTTFAVDGCDVEKKALDECAGKSVCLQAAEKLCDQCGFSCIDPSAIGNCSGYFACQSACNLQATCEDIALSPAGSAYADCISKC